MDSTRIAYEIALELGFDLVGGAPLAPPRRAAEFVGWLDAGNHGSMAYLERNRERIVDPSRVLEGGRSLLLVGLGHSREALELPGGARVARYAAGRDYHNWMGKRLLKLRKRLEAQGLAGPFRGVVDAGPLMERSHAAQAGLGSESKAANLLTPGFGPWFFLGELLLGEELEPGAANAGGGDLGTLPNCGTCTACLDACPTQAIVAPGQVDARRCISYLTIEHRGAIARDLRAEIGAWVFGCDVCSEVCPWGSEAVDTSGRLGSHRALEGDGGSPLVGWLLDLEGFSERLNGSPLQRPRREGLARNAAIVLGNLPSDEGREALITALERDPAPEVRSAAGWALAHGHAEDAGTSSAIGRACRLEPDAEAREDLGLSAQEASERA